MITLELAEKENARLYFEMIEEGRRFQQEQGFVQWTKDYPNLDTIRGDIQAEKGYVLKAEGEAAAYMCIDFGGEPAYDHIEGAWRAEEPYAVVHRLAFAGKFRGKGLADKVFSLVEELCQERGIRYIRVDTDFPNKRMQHILEKNGYVNCGVVIFQGSGKLAYDKIL